MAWEHHLIFNRSEPAGLTDAQSFCLDEGRDDTAVVAAREDAIRDLKTLKIRVGATEVSADVLSVQFTGQGDGAVIRVAVPYHEFDVYYSFKVYAA